MADRKLEFELKVRDAGTRVLKMMEESVKRLENETKSLERSGASAGSTFSSVFSGSFLGSAAAGGFTKLLGVVQDAFSSVINLGKDAIEIGQQFQLEMGLVGGLTEEAFQMLPKLGEDAQRTAMMFGLELNDTAKGLFNVISATGKASESIEVLTASARLAVAGGASLQMATDAIVRTLNAYNLAGSEAARVSDAIFAAQQGGITTISELAEFMGHVVPAAAAAGISLEELGASIATTTKVIKSQIALTGLRNFFIAVDSASTETAKKSREMAREVGNTSFEFSKAGLKALGLTEFLKQLVQITHGGAQGISEFGIETRTMSVLLQLLVDDTKVFQGQMENMNKSVGITERAMGRMADTGAIKMKQLGSQIEVLKNLIFEELEPGISKFADSVTQDFDTIKLVASIMVDTMIVAFTRLIDVMSSVAAGVAASAQMWSAFLPDKVEGFAKDATFAFVSLSESMSQTARVAEDRLGKNLVTLISLMTATRDGANDTANGLENAGNTGTALTGILSELTAESIETARSMYGLGTATDAVTASQAGITARFAEDLRETLSPEAMKKLIKSLQEGVRGLDSVASGIGQGQVKRQMVAVEHQYAELRRVVGDNQEALALINEAEFKELDNIYAEHLENRTEALDEQTRDALRLEEETHEQLDDLLFSAHEVEIREIKRHYAKLQDEAEGNKDALVALKKAEQNEIARVRAEQNADVGFGEGFEQELRDFVAEADNAGKQGARVARTLHTGMTEAFKGIITGSKTAGEAFAQFGRRIVDTMAEIAAEMAASALMKMLLSALFNEAAGAATNSGASGNTPDSGPTQSSVSFDAPSGGGTTQKGMADGGIITQRTHVVAGEAGAEAFIPLKNGSVPVQMKSPAGASDSQPVQVVFEIQAVDARSFRSLAAEHKDFFSDMIADAMTRRANLRRTVQQAAR